MTKFFLIRNINEESFEKFVNNIPRRTSINQAFLDIIEKQAQDTTINKRKERINSGKHI